MTHAYADDAREYFHRYHLKNGDHRRALMRANYQVKKEEYKKRAREWRQANLIKSKAQAARRGKLWIENNRARHNARVTRQRIAKLQTTPMWLTFKQEQEILEFYTVAQYVNLTVDHIVPIQGKIVCGLHVPWNLQLITNSENSSKSNRFMGGG